jgi:CubicO group peptidase (beta-lactamase class C family)
LNDGKSPTTGNRILEARTVQEMFTNQIPNMPDFGRQGVPAAKPDLTNPLGDMYPQPPEQAQGWGLSMFMTIHPAATGRGANTGWWAGLPNLFWWCDREKGVAGIIASQIVPFGGK